MCRDGCCHHSPRSRLRDLLLAIALLLAGLVAASGSVHRRLQRQIDRTQQSLPVPATVQPPSAETPSPPALTAPATTSDSWLPLALGSLATLTFFAFWYWALLKAQSLHPRTRGYPNYDTGGHGGSAL